MLLNPWSEVQKLEQRLDSAIARVGQLQSRVQIQTTSYLVLQREIVNANYALRRKNKQLKQLKALVELHKEYVKLHP